LEYTILGATLAAFTSVVYLYLSDVAAAAPHVLVTANTAEAEYAQTIFQLVQDVVVAGVACALKALYALEGAWHQMVP